MEQFLGLDIGGTKCAVVLGDKDGNVLEKIRFDTTTFSETLEALLAAARQLITPEVAAIGISCGGPLDSRRGMILSPPNLPGWDAVPIVKLLEDRFGIPAFLKNDADACAIAEWKWGSAQGYENAVFLTFGTGMGAGLILNGKPYSGAYDMAGEVGHIRLYDSGHIGYGKQGSFEGYCSGGGIAQYGRGSAKALAIAARNGDQAAIDLYKKVGRDLGKGLSYIIDILNPQVIVIGSIFTRAQDLLEDAMYEVLRREVLSYSLEAVKILPAKLGDEIGDKAALGVAYAGLTEVKRKP